MVETFELGVPFGIERNSVRVLILDTRAKAIFRKRFVCADLLVDAINEHFLLLGLRVK